MDDLPASASPTRSGRTPQSPPATDATNATGSSPHVSLRPGLWLLHHPTEGPMLLDGEQLHRPEATVAWLLERLDSFDGPPREVDVLGSSPGPQVLQAWSRLRRSGVVVDVELPARMVRGVAGSERAAALAEATALVGEDPAGAERRWGRRRTSTVLVVGSGATTTVLVPLLRASGLEVAAGADGERRLLSRPGLTVLTYDHEPPTDTVERLMRESLPHLVAGTRGVDGHVGPLVQPGSTPCLRCVDLTRSHTEHGWAVLREQLSGLRGHRAGAAPAAASRWVTAATAALAAADVLAMVDGLPACTVGATAVFRPGEPLPTLRAWPVHPLCGCTWQA